MSTCFKCHGGDKVSSKFRVDSREALIKGGEGGPAIVVGDPKNSPLIQAIAYGDEDFQMPPKKRLSKEVVADFAKWIRDGAQWPAKLTIDNTPPIRHWSFQPVAKVTPPTGAWSKHPIDGFIRAIQKSKQINPVHAADRRSLIRRASFDLVGLPPSPAEVEAFVDDNKPDAFARVIERLMASPRYGERWGRHWLDLVRYADTAGENSDYPIPEAYLYRDYVIDSFNADKPYDQFLHEQIAGDILAKQGPADKYAERVIATGFIAQSKRFGTNKLEDMHLIIEDTLQTMGQVVLGLSLRCARCHDHKYDPTTSEDYYALYGVFQSTAYPFPGGESVKQPSEFVSTVDPKELAKRDSAYQAKHAEEIKRIKGDIDKLKRESAEAKHVDGINKEIASLNDALKKKLGDKGATQKMLASLKKQLPNAQKKLAAKTKPLTDKLSYIDRNKPSKQVQLAYGVREGKPDDAVVQVGGNPHSKGKAVRRAAPQFLSTFAKLDVPSKESGRLQLAKWLTDPKNPLTARVMVNRIWQYHFGKPIVATPSDFGMQGEAPTHPKLLDWLAAKFVRSDYSIKAMHRTIMSSKTYQLAVADHSANAAKDGGNTTYWRFDRRRLDAEAIRDSMLALGGNLDLKRPGPHPFPPKNKWRWTAHHQFKAVYPSNHRSVYLMVQRLHPHPYLSLFNGPNTSSSTAMRDQSTVALQSLFMLNSGFVHKQAQGLAAQLIKATHDPAPRKSRIKLAYERVYSRPATDDEVARMLAYHDRYVETLAAENVPTNQREHETWSSIARMMLTSNEFIYVN